MFLNFRMAELLLRRYRQLGENWRKVSRDMGAKVLEGKPIDRRKLAKLAECSDTVRVTIPEMRRLQKYLVKCGLVGYHENAFFSPPTNLLDALRGESNVTVFYPSRKLSDFHTEGASRWDLRAIQALNGVPEINSMNFAIQDVFHLGPDHADANKLTRYQATQRWYSVLDEERALISIGAPFACYATEVILSRMFNVKPYQRHGLNTRQPLPFYLYWPERTHTSDSAFSVTREELKRHYPDQFGEMDPDTRAVLIGGKLYPAPKFGDSMNLIVAQYWRGHLALVLLGVYAPSTLMIAKLLAEGRVSESLGPYRYTKSESDSESPWESQPILINKIKTTISRASADKDDELSGLIDERRQAGLEPVGWERWQWRDKKFELRGSGSFAAATDVN